MIASSSSRHRKNRQYQIKKTGIKDEFIDKQIVAIHRAIADKLLAQPALIEQVKQQLQHKRKQGLIGYGEYITWLSLLEISDQPALFRQGMLEYSSKMRRLRRRTPFVGILNEQERQQALDAEAIGITSIESLL